MRLTLALLVFPALLAPAGWGQTAAAPPSALPTASSLLAPAIQDLKGSLTSIRVDKWKGSGSRREESDSNIGSIRRDLDATLPGLLAKADAAPADVSENLPVYRNIDALYDVLLRVVETADLFAPKADAETLHSALSSLENARKSLGDALETAAVTQQQQVTTLRAQVEAQQQQAASSKAAPATVVNDSAAPAPTPAHKRRKAKPATQPPTSQ